jgi:hypothetical protein
VKEGVRCRIIPFRSVRIDQRAATHHPVNILNSLEDGGGSQPAPGLDALRMAVACHGVAAGRRPMTSGLASQTLTDNTARCAIHTFGSQ